MNDQNDILNDCTQGWEDTTDCPLQEVDSDTSAVLHDEPRGHPDTAADDGACQVRLFVDFQLFFSLIKVEKREDRLNF